MFTTLTALTGLLLGAQVLRHARPHWVGGNHLHPHPLPVRHALLVGAVEVLVDPPLMLHRRRVEVVRAAEERRADAREQAMLRHPASHAERRACMRRHPAFQAAPALAPVEVVG